MNDLGHMGNGATQFEDPVLVYALSPILSYKYIWSLHLLAFGETSL